MYADMRLLICAAAVAGAGAASAQITVDELYWNPVPMEDDVVLPAPCGFGMALRRVETTVANNWLADEAIQLGNSGIEGQEHSESIVNSSIVGSLTKGDAATRYYLIGKYEITADQYSAITTGVCPTPSDAGSEPAENMSWFDAQRFTAAYTDWLYSNARDAVEAAAGPGAFVRLPTEREWEFAARGGLAVTEAERRQRVFSMDGPLTDYVWFAGFKSCDGITQPVGLLEPNPLGLFDILGNVQELTQDLYALRKRERTHGQVGGVTARGGSCLTSENRVRTAERDEVHLFDLETGEPRGKPFTGFRIVFGSPILTDQGRITAINDNWQSIGDLRLDLDPRDDPVVTLARLAEVEEDTVVREALENARAAFEREIEIRNGIEGRSARSVVQNGTLVVRSYILDLQNIAQAEGFVQADPENPIAQSYLQRANERLDITKDFLLNAVLHAAEDFGPRTLSDASLIVRDEYRNRMAAMTEQTRFTTARMQETFLQFVEMYRETSDTDPEVFFGLISDLFSEFRQRAANQNWD